MKNIIGTNDLKLAEEILKQSVKSLGISGELAAKYFEELNPENPMEGMLVAQMTAAHCHCMRMFADARKTHSPDIEAATLKIAVKLMKAFGTSMRTLEKTRRKGEQNVKVEHVHIHQGAQAIVGNVTQGGNKNDK